VIGTVLEIALGLRGATVDGVLDVTSIGGVRWFEAARVEVETFRR
jgi:hypothetical protein